MNLAIKATHTTITPAISAAIEDKFSALEHFLRPEDMIRVEIEADSKISGDGSQRVEVHITPHGHYAEARGEDVYVALDLVLPKIKEQLSKEKGKKISLRRRLGRLFKRTKI